MEYVLETNNLSKKYKNTLALNKLNMHVPKGAIYGFVGRNGAGKTTLISLVCGLIKPTEGDFCLYGAWSDGKAVKKQRRRMGAIVETPSFYGNMTAKENLRQQGLLLGLPSFDYVDEILNLVGLQNTGKKKAKNFSLGMKQRLGIAVALVGDPDLLILDEPVNGLDPQGIIEIRELILKLNKERQITVMISSHILDELARIATHYGFIDNGCMIKEMNKEELEDACQKRIYVEVTDAKILARVLDVLMVPYEIISDKEAYLFEKISVSQLAALLEKENCEILSMQEKEESLESFYISLIGGDHHV